MGERAIFWAAVAVSLVPVWAFRFIPTQDGPSHLANAVILKDFTGAGARYPEFFKIAREPLPNWTSHALLAGLMHVFPALAAEKTLVSLYIVGFAAAFRFFLAGFGREGAFLAPIGLLLLFNRCFFLGFYNYCLGLVLYWLILGYCVRKRQSFGITGAAVVAPLLLAAYFTHLVSCLLAIGSALWLVGATGKERVRRLTCAALAAVPACWLIGKYLAANGFFRPRPDGVAWAVSFDLANSNLEFFETHEGTFVPMGILALCLFEGLFLASLFAGTCATPKVQVKTGSAGASPSQELQGARWPIGVLAIAFAAAYIFLPDAIGVQGGFLKTRFAQLPPLLCLALFRLPEARWFRRGLATVILLLLGMNLVLVVRHLHAKNQELVEFTAAIDLVGKNQTLRAVGTSSHDQRPNPLEHAADYYCLGTGNIDLDNYEAGTRHFPVRWRQEFATDRKIGFPHSAAPEPDILVLWDQSADAPPMTGSSYREIFHRERLRVLEKVPPKKP